jgi:DNA/RNA-binding domain of Phe-tRNA-synthetase-like protein
LVWTDAFRLLHTDPKRFAPAHLALRKRVQRPGAELPFISRAVAVMNLASIEGVLPVGGDDLARVMEFGDLLELGPAVGEEIFVPLGHPDQEEHPDPGEVVLAVNGQACCRRWCWRNGHATRIGEETAALAMNIDGLGPGSEARTVATRDRVALLLEQHCQATTITGLLSRACPEIVVSAPRQRPWEPTEGW